MDIEAVVFAFLFIALGGGCWRVGVVCAWNHDLHPGIEIILYAIGFCSGLVGLAIFLGNLPFG